MSQHIYEILVFTEPVTSKCLGIPEYGYRESMGFFYDRDTAYKAIKENWADINEAGAYPAALLIEKEEGLYPLAKKLNYFIYNQETDGYDEQEIPSVLKVWNIS